MPGSLASYVLASSQKDPDERHVAWKLNEAQRFLAAAQRDPLVNAFTLLLHLGMRRGELIGLQWDDIDMQAGQLRIRRTIARVGGRLVVGPVKTRSGFRPLPLLPVVRAALDDQRVRQQAQREKADADWTEHGYVFTTRSGNPVEPRNVARSFAGSSTPPSCDRSGSTTCGGRQRRCSSRSGCRLVTR